MCRRRLGRRHSSRERGSIVRDVGDCFGRGVDRRVRCCSDVRELSRLGRQLKLPPHRERNVRRRQNGPLAIRDSDRCVVVPVAARRRLVSVVASRACRRCSRIDRVVVQPRRRGRSRPRVSGRRRTPSVSERGQKSSDGVLINRPRPRPSPFQYHAGRVPFIDFNVGARLACSPSTTSQFCTTPVGRRVGAERRCQNKSRPAQAHLRPASSNTSKFRVSLLACVLRNTSRGFLSMTKRVLAAAIVTLPILIGVAHATPITLVANGSFESGLSGWSVAGGGAFPVSAVQTNAACCFGEFVPNDNIVGGSPDAAGNHGVY